ncbi:DUF6350 family protein [Frigoribacterium sp. CFBP9039]|uniref:cell division protein PerM n=1 Tax=Frigoribacterium sp. CFBP9029 TaxID=3096541 RepID=UPI002A6A9068|nr:DUF6350 family protein [Frigoribacterium sp. CFBP9039]MDY0945506.1 DUF6350 family protein [Frigoribacterium sp. CFBP9039]
MNRPATAAFAALEALLVVGIGVGLPVAITSLLWAFQYGLQLDWVIFWRASIDTWLVGHGVDVTLRLGGAAAEATGVAGADAPIHLTIAALGFSALTVVFGIRAGRAIAETEHRVVGLLTTIGTFALLSTGLAATAQHELASPSLWQAVVLPPLVYAVPVLAMAEITRRRRGEDPGAIASSVTRLVVRAPLVARIVAAGGLRAGVAIASVVVACAAVVVALLLLTHFAQIITLYEGAHGGLLGGLALTIGQLALLPNIVVWAASWLVGPGFALGTGSGISPLGTSVGPLPALPIFGALPTADLPFAFVGLLVPVVAAYVVTTLLRPRLQAALAAAGVDDTLRRVLVGVTAGVVAGVALGAAAWASAGSAGPGRLVDVGPNPWAVGGFTALEVAVPAVLAMIVAPPRFVTGGGLPTRASSGVARDAGATASAASSRGAGSAGRSADETARAPREFGTPRPGESAGGAATATGIGTGTSTLAPESAPGESSEAETVGVDDDDDSRIAAPRDDRDRDRDLGRDERDDDRDARDRDARDRDARARDSADRDADPDVTGRIDGITR